MWWVEAVLQRDGPIALVSWIFWVIFSITLHELAHGWAAIAQGDRTPIERGHMTMNPLVHMGPMSLLLFALAGIAWGAMPVNPHRFRSGARGDVLVSGAGPAMNFALSLACIAVLGLLLRFGTAPQNLAMFLYTGAFLNIALGLLNLLPVPPLDGSRIVAGVIPETRRLYDHPNAPIVGLAVFFLIFFVTPLGSLLWLASHVIADTGIQFLAGGPSSGP